MKHFYLYLMAVLFGSAMIGSVVLAGPVVGSNILSNPGFESASPSGWQVLSGSWNRGNWAPGPYEGSYYYYPGPGNWSTIYQDFDLAALGYDADRLATGGYWADFGGYQASWSETWPSAYDQGLIGLRQYTSAWAINEATELGWSASGAWTLREGSKRLDPATTRLRYWFDAQRRDMWGGNNDAYLDATFLSIHEYDIWTWGNNTANHAGTGSWNTGTGDVAFGNTGAGRVYVTNGATMTTDGRVFLGATGSGNGTVNVKGGTWRANDSVWVGDDGPGTVNVSGGTWYTNESAFIGRAGTGVVNVTNGGRWTGRSYIGRDIIGWAHPGTVNLSGGTWDVIGSITVGGYNTGQINVNPGGQWFTNGGTVGLGDTLSASGTVNVSGGTWTGNSTVEVGQLRPGEVNVNAGGQWTTDGPVYIAADRYDPNNWVGSGQVNVSDGVWTANNDVSVGHQGPGVVTVSNGGLWTTAGDVYLGSNSSSAGTVNIAGGTWNANADVIVGLSGAGMLNLNAGGTMTVKNIDIRHTGTLTLDGGTLWVTNGGFLNSSGLVQFTGAGGTVHLDDAYLIHSMQTLALNGDDIVGSGELNVGSAGIDLGTVANPGSLIGTSAQRRLVVFGHVFGSGSMTNVTVYGDVNVGSSPGEMTLANVEFGSSSTILMEIAGVLPDEYDRLILDAGVNFGSATIDVTFVDGFTPGLSNIFQLFAATGGGDLYSALHDVTINTSAGWYVDPATGILAVPEPATLIILVTGLTALARRRGEA